LVPLIVVDRKPVQLVAICVTAQLFKPLLTVTPSFNPP